MLPPAIWLGVVLSVLRFCRVRDETLCWSQASIIPLVLLLHGEAGPETTVVWTPYQQVQYTPVHTPDGEIYGGTDAGEPHALPDRS